MFGLRRKGTYHNHVLRLALIEVKMASFCIASLRPAVLNNLVILSVKYQNNVQRAALTQSTHIQETFIRQERVSFQTMLLDHRGNLLKHSGQS